MCERTAAPVLREERALAASFRRRQSYGKTLSKALGRVQSLTVLKSSCEVFQSAKKTLSLSAGGWVRVPRCWNSDTMAEAAAAAGEVSTCTRLLCLSSAGDFVQEHLFSEVLDCVGVSFPRGFESLGLAALGGFASDEVLCWARLVKAGVPNEPGSN